jgi:pro-apoptotic serine protease NMA111
VPRSIVPVHPCDVWVEIGNRNFPGRVLYIDNFSVVTIDGKTPRTMKALPISQKELNTGDKVELFTMDISKQVTQKATEIKEIAAAMSGPFGPPRWRVTNTEALYVLETASNDDGVILDPEDKSVIALWLSSTGFEYNRCFKPIIEALKKGEEYESRCCGWIFLRMTLADALQLGFSEERAVQMSNTAKELKVVPYPCYVSGRLRPSAEGFKIGDIILEVNGRSVIRMRDIQDLSRMESAQVLVLRNRQETLITFAPYRLPSVLSRRVIFWAGAYLHETHDPVLEQLSPEFAEMAEREGIVDIQDCVYVSSVMDGSPLSTGAVSEARWIMEVDRHKVRSMEDMLKAIESLKGDTRDLTVKVTSCVGFTSVHSVRLDAKFWPAWSLEHKNDKWVRTELE